MFEKSLLPHELFKVFLTNTEMERTRVVSTNYAHLKGDFTFTITVEKLKAFLTVLIDSGYAYSANDIYIWQIITLSIIQVRPLFSATNEQCNLDYQPT